jgi:hypothetical protein
MSPMGQGAGVARIDPSTSVRRDVTQLVFSFFWLAGVTFGDVGGVPLVLRVVAAVVFAVLTVVPAVALVRRYARGRAGAPPV